MGRSWGWARWHLLERILTGAIVLPKYLTVCLVVSPRKAHRFFWSLGHHVLAYEHTHTQARIPAQPIEGMFPGIERVEVTLADASWEDGNVSMVELYLLCAIARHQRIRSALEIGTFRGLVMASLARNTEPDTRLLTVDLRQEDLGRLRRPLALGEALYVQKAKIGEKIANLPEELRSRVTQLYGDSTQLDFSPYYGRIDLVFIDGSHQYDYVAHDSQEAFRMRSPQGMIIWQDYLVWPDVTRYLNRLSREHPLVRVAGTSLVLYRPS
ncbi:MAG: class I SAM-dependent methyltransferase [Candidatus Omnitrophica bacterium]|nr:class I SAM-dependent methyltransferase [Candidatus Omnitrophota bacterium]